uniref:DUF295 domain-containing protein n=1 Tax=Oryza punctata TaxID=4537 RepID=A0A0E0MGT7_ORYPU
MELTSAGAAVIQDWERLPEDLLVTVFCQLEIPDLLRSGAVCASWHAAYRTFCRLRLPSPKQPPCFLYSCDDYGPDTAALYCPSTGATYRIPAPCDGFRSLSLIGSADGWVVAADEIGNLHLLNPLTGGQAELPPLSTMHHVEAAFDEEEGGLVYDIDADPSEHPDSPMRVPARGAQNFKYDRAVLSCGPHSHAGDAAACVVLLLHMPMCELSYARPGDDQWTWVSPDAGTGLQWRNWYSDAAYNKNDGLFYVVRRDNSVHALDLTGPSPVAKKVFHEGEWSRNLANGHVPRGYLYSRYLVHVPWGELVHFWRFRDSVSSYDPWSDDQYDGDDDDDFCDNDSCEESSSEDEDNDSCDPFEEFITIDIQLNRTDFHGQKLESMDSLDDHALFLCYNASLCLPTKDFPGLNPNCVYITDDFIDQTILESTSEILVCGASRLTSTGAAVIQDWERLPEDLLVTVFCQLEIPDLLRSGAVCASWHAAYCTFRRLRLPSPKQPPCLLYSCDAYGPDAAGLYCPSTGATYRIPAPCGGFRSLSLIGSADGWVVAADEIGNLRLLNPLTGGQAELPPLSTMHHVEATFDEEEGGLVYDIDEDDPSEYPNSPVRILAREAQSCMYDRAVLSCGPHSHAGDAAACVVLLLHRPMCELSYARPGDDRWTWVSPDAGTGLQWRNWYSDAAYNKNDGLFYVVRQGNSVHALDLTGPSPVAKKVFHEGEWSRNLANGHVPRGYLYSRYLVHVPWGELVHVWRFRESVSSYDPSSEDQYDDDDDDDLCDNDSCEESSSEDEDNDSCDPSEELITIDIQLNSTDFHGQKLKPMDSLDDHALFLGYNASLCLPTKDFPGLNPNCVYITDDFIELVNYSRINKRDIGVWSIEGKTLQSLEGASHLKDPWLNWPAPIWITPSLL